MHKVVMPFPCSWDGVTAVDLAVGDVRDFGTMADGLIGMGWIEPIAIEPTNSVVAVETVAEREVVVDFLPVEVAESTEAKDEESAEEVTLQTASRRGRKRK